MSSLKTRILRIFYCVIVIDMVIGIMYYFKKGGVLNLIVNFIVGWGKILLPL